VTLHTDIPTRSAVEHLVADAVEQLQTTQADRGAVTDVRESLDDLVGDDDFWSE
jgi:hypothetical protein